MASWKSEGGGGYLNGVAFVINEVKMKFAEFEGQDDDANKKVTAAVKLTPDGGDEVEQFFDAGFAPDGMTITKDGKLKFEGTKRLSSNSDWIRLVSSAVETGFPEAELDESEGADFSVLEGYRFIGQREKDPEQQKRVGRSRLKRGVDAFGKKVSKNAKPTDEEAFEAGKRGVKKGEHKGKLFDLDILLVKTVGKDGESSTKGKTSKATTSKASKATESDDDASDGPDTDRKDEVLIAVLKEHDGTLNRGNLQGRFVTWAAENDVEKPERDALRDAIYDEDYLNNAAERGIITYDSDEKKQPITLKAAKKKR